MMDLIQVIVGRELFYVSPKDLMEASFASPWAKAMIKYEGSSGKFNLPETDPNMFKIFLKILSDKQPPEISASMEEMMSVLLQAHMWDFSDVVKKCCQFFSAKVQDHYNFIFNNTATLDLKNDLDDDAFFLLKWNIRKEFECNNYLEWNSLTWMRILMDDYLNLEEIVIFKALQSWKNFKDVSMWEVRRLVAFVRFPLISKEDFEKYVAISGILDDLQVENLRNYYLERNIDSGFNCTPRKFKLGIHNGVEF
ncbi:uncharacterized protein LOC110845564 [Folsomia candida]|uniref:BTB/POZ domain-containing protein 2 n=1 Tax=Folsomia candida TaxID=158441 RepID=A0A226EHE9_FOLCA|nr:uncharacterized protein LOC110845564 [Folsomia candida]OXA56678.1 BTB/POZ domain-containing protein 2 [Folsomia candida]